MIAEFLAWWGEQLVSLLPKRFVGFTGADGDSVFLSSAKLAEHADGGELPIRRRAGRRQGSAFKPAVGGPGLERRISGHNASNQVILAVPADHVLAKTLTLPSVVERDIEQVLSYEMDSETPFSVDEVFWDWRVLTHDRALGKLSVRLLVSLKSMVEPELDRFRKSGVSPSAILVERPDGSRDLLRLSHQSEAVNTSVWARPKVIWSVFGVLAVLVVGIPFLRLGVVAHAVEARILEVRGAAEEAQKLISERDGTAGGGGAVHAMEQRFGNPLVALAVVTDALPDDSFLSDFVMRERKMTISGQSAGATRLIGALAANPAIADPAFAAPVTRLGSEGGGREVFSINAELRKKP